MDKSKYTNDYIDNLLDENDEENEYIDSNELLNINNENKENYYNYIKQKSKENQEYKDILKNIESNSDSNSDINSDSDSEIIEDYNNNNIDNIDGFNNIIETKFLNDNILNKNNYIEVDKYLVINSIDRDWLNNDNGAWSYSVHFNSINNLSEYIDLPIYENSPYIPFSLYETTSLLTLIPNNGILDKFSKGFIFKGLEFDIFDSKKPFGEILGYDKFLLQFKSSTNIKCNYEFRNITRIEFIEALMPILKVNMNIPNVNYIRNKNYPTFKNFDIAKNILDINKDYMFPQKSPYLILSIDEIPSQVVTTDLNNDNKIFSIMRQKSINKTEDEYISFNSISGGKVIYNQSPLSSLNTLSINITNQAGSNEDFNKFLGGSSIGINGYGVTSFTPNSMIPNLLSNISASFTYDNLMEYKEYIKQENPINNPLLNSMKEDINDPVNQLFIKIKLSNYFLDDSFKKGDRIKIKGFFPYCISAEYHAGEDNGGDIDNPLELSSSFINNRILLKKLYDYINRDTGHIIKDTDFSDEINNNTAYLNNIIYIDAPYNFYLISGNIIKLEDWYVELIEKKLLLIDDYFYLPTTNNNNQNSIKPYVKSFNDSILMNSMVFYMMFWEEIILNSKISLNNILGKCRIIIVEKNEKKYYHFIDVKNYLNKIQFGRLINMNAQNSLIFKITELKKNSNDLKIYI